MKVEFVRTRKQRVAAHLGKGLKTNELHKTTKLARNVVTLC